MCSGEIPHNIWYVRKKPKRQTHEMNQFTFVSIYFWACSPHTECSLRLYDCGPVLGNGGG